MILIGITGNAQSGKSYIADRLARRHGFAVSRFAEPIKLMLRVGLGLSADQVDGHRKTAPIEWLDGVSPRQLMQSLGHDWGRKVRSDIWVKIWERSLDIDLERVVVDDIRYHNEAAAIRNLGGLIWRVTRPGIIAEDHPSELAVNSIEADAIIMNNTGVEPLYRRVDELVEEAKGRSR